MRSQFFISLLIALFARDVIEMGIREITTKVVSCDICQNSCGENDSDIEIKVNNGDGRDVGAAYITGRIVFHQPYGCSNGIVCNKCKIKYLKKYINELEQPK